MGTPCERRCGRAIGVADGSMLSVHAPGAVRHGNSRLSSCSGGPRAGHMKRRYVYCANCDVGAAPAQKALGLSDSDFTPRLEEVCTMLATTVPHGMAVTIASKVCGVDVSIKAVEDMIGEFRYALP